jgi:hypothetical protein
MVIVTGSRLESSTGDRVVGIQAKEGIALSADTFLYPQSVAKIPPHVSDRDAISTLLVALAGVHCVLPRIEGVGGSDDEFVLGGKVRQPVCIGSVGWTRCTVCCSAVYKMHTLPVDD